MELTYRKAKRDDLNEIVMLVQDAISDMSNKSIFQWDELYPAEEDFQMDIDEDSLYVGLVDDKIAVIFVLNKDYDDEYEDANWKEPHKSYLVLHRLCVSPKYQNKGLGKKILAFIESEVKSNHHEAIRLDVFSENPMALKLYTGVGYEQVGFADWRKGRFYLMEKYI